MDRHAAPRHKIVIALILLVQLLILTALGVMIVRRDRSPITIPADSAFWYSGTVSGWEPGGRMRIAPDNLTAPFDALAAQEKGDTAGHDGRIIAFFGPLASLARCGYTVTLEYSAQSVQTVACRSELEGQLLSGAARLMPGEHRRVSFDVLALLPTDAFRMDIEYDGAGELEIFSAVIQTNSRLQRMELTGLLLLFLSADTLFLYRKKLKKHRTAILGVAAIVFVSSLPLFTPSLAMGHDLRFHLLRIENLYEGLLRGELPVRTAPLYYDGLGYAAPIFYGDLLLTVPALLRIAGFSVTAAYKLYILFINMLTAVIGYGCFHALLKDRRTALTAAFCWCTAAYRFSNVYVRAALGEYSAMAFLPLILLAFIRIYDDKDGHSLLQNAVLMASGMAMVLMSHVLTTEIVCLCLLAAVLLCIRRTLRPRVLLTWLTAAGLTVLLSLWYIVPFIEYYVRVPVMIAQPLAKSVQLMQGRGACVSDLFDFFRNAFAMESGRDLLMTPGPVLMAAMLIGLWQAANGKTDKAVKLSAAAAGLLLLMATDLFPWNALAAYTPLGGLTGLLQFPWRWLTAACLLLALLTGLLLNGLRAKNEQLFRQATAAAVLMCILSAGILGGSYTVSGEPYAPFSTADLDTGWTSVGEYKRFLPVYGGYDGYGVTEEKRGDAQTDCMESSGERIILQVKTSEESTVDFPRYRYLYQTVTDEAGNNYAISDSEDCRVRAVVPAGFEGRLTLTSYVPVHWRIAEAVSVLTAVGLLLCVILQKKRRGRSC